MIIQRIKITNYRQYQGDTVLDLDKNSEKNINVIIGATGVGKTNLSSAIQWCLYGDELIDKGTEFGILNMNTFETLHEDEEAKVLVELMVKTNQEQQYTISRSITISKRANKQTTIDHQFPSIALDILFPHMAFQTYWRTTNLSRFYKVSASVPWFCRP